MKKITVDFSAPLTEIKPLHGVNNSPMTVGEAIPSFVAAGIPFVRTHDTGGYLGGGRFIDVPNLFPDFNRDPDDPEAFDFAFTDAYLKGVIASGCRVFYRLGVTIENDFRIKAYRIAPPPDSMKWARVCEKIIRHYNEGWNHGFHYGIEYWEIWNEPENPPMWSGTKEQFFELYRIASNHLKKCFPSLKIGGYAACGFYSLTRKDACDFYKSFTPYFTDFLDYITAPETKAPLDFFSWHFYCRSTQEHLIHADFVDSELKKRGLNRTESIFDEWNFLDQSSNSRFDTAKEMPAAAFIAESFCLMQNSHIDKAMYYDAYPLRSYCGLYYFPSMRVTKTYYAFRAFHALYSMSRQVKLSGIPKNGRLRAVAAGSPDNGTILIVNRSKRAAVVSLEIRNGTAPSAVYLLDDKHDLVKWKKSTGKQLTLPPLSVAVIRCGDIPDFILDTPVSMTGEVITNGLSPV